MQDRELYRRILGIETPWRVKSVDLKLDEGEVHVHLAHEPVGEWQCPECGSACKLYDHQPERQWRHLDTCPYQTMLHAEPPRSQCPQHGVKVVKLPWAEPSSRFTELFEALAIEFLKAASQKAVAGLLKLSWDEIHGIMERAVQRGLERRKAEVIPQIGIDEKAFRKGLEGIESVAMDMWDPYINSVKAHVLEADDKIVFDKFHVAQHLGAAVDQVRRGENKILKARGDDRLAGTR